MMSMPTWEIGTLRRCFWSRMPISIHLRCIQTFLVYNSGDWSLIRQLFVYLEVFLQLTTYPAKILWPSRSYSTNIQHSLRIAVVPSQPCSTKRHSRPWLAWTHKYCWGGDFTTWIQVSCLSDWWGHLLGEGGTGHGSHQACSHASQLSFDFHEVC